MSAEAGRPFFRTTLRPILEQETTISGARASVLRSAVWLAWPAAELENGSGEAKRILGMAFVAPELPYSVLPCYLREQVSIALSQDVPELWHGRPIPSWRGVPCRIGVVGGYFRNEMDETRPFVLPILFLLPERDPPGPRFGHALLGSQFFTQYGMQIVLDYGAVRYRYDPTAGRRGIDLMAACGRIEIA